MTLEHPIHIHLGAKDMSLGVTYVMLSRAKRLGDIHLYGPPAVTEERFTTGINGESNSALARHRNELTAEVARLQKLSSTTTTMVLEWS
jgi:hypothetical protein